MFRVNAWHIFAFHLHWGHRSHISRTRRGGDHFWFIRRAPTHKHKMEIYWLHSTIFRKKVNQNQKKKKQALLCGF